MGAKPKRERVEVFTAHMWICPQCGIKNFEEGITVEDPDLIAEAREHFGGEGELRMLPLVVKCSQCGTKFSTDDEPEDDEDNGEHTQNEF